MAKDILQHAGSKSGEAVIVIPDSVKKNLPGDFDIGDIGNIDLNEAEKIASEDMLLIRESELVDGLEDFNLIPLDEDAEVSGPASTRKRVIVKTEIEPEIHIESLAPEEEFVALEENAAPMEDETMGQEMTESAVPEQKTEEVEFDDGRTWIALEELEKYDEHGHKWTPLEELVLEDDKHGVAEKANVRGDADIASGIADTREASTEKSGRLREPTKAPVMVEGYVESDDEYIIWDMPASENAIENKEEMPAGRVETTGKSSNVAAVSSAETGLPINEGLEEKGSHGSEDDVVISMEDYDVGERPAKGTEDLLKPLEYKDTLQKTAISVDIDGQAGKSKNERGAMQYEDLISAGILGVASELGKAQFIDDSPRDGGSDDKSIFNESDLDRIISGMVQVEEGAAYVMREANVDEDRERIALISDEFGSSHEDLFVDLDYKYSDQELDYIHTAIVEEDYSSYIREIDEFFGVPGGKTIPAAVELMGLTADEFDTIEDMLYKDEFKDIHIFDRYHLYEFDRSAKDGQGRDKKNCRYLLPEEDSLMDYERDSIESDVSSGSALIFEEDIRDITEQLIRRTGKTEDEIRQLVEKTFGAESIELTPKGDLGGTVAGEAEPGVEATSAQGRDEIYDITDRVVILDNEADVDRFVKEFPPGKQMNIKMLLKYLDGLFETLPEEIIKKFASSEYFDLYLKVLNELGV